MNVVCFVCLCLEVCVCTRMGVVVLCVCLGTVQYWWISTGLVIVQLRAIFCPSVQYLLLICEAFSWTILDSSCFPLFHSGQVFHQLVCPLTDVLPQIFFSLTTLFSYPVFFSLFHAPLDVVVHFHVFLRSLRLKSFLSQFSPFVTQIDNFSSDPGFFLLTMFAKDLTGCFSHCCVEGGDHWITVCIISVHDGERCKLPAYPSLESFQHVEIFELLEVRLESCVFWLADFFFRRWQKVIISKSWSLPMSAPGKLRVLAMFTPDRKRFFTRM